MANEGLVRDPGAYKYNHPGGVGGQAKVYWAGTGYLEYSKNLPACHSGGGSKRH